MLFVARGWAVFCFFVLSRRGMHLVLLETFAVIRPRRFELGRIGVAERRSVRRLKLRVVFREIRFARRGHTGRETIWRMAYLQTFRRGDAMSSKNASFGSCSDRRCAVIYGSEERMITAGGVLVLGLDFGRRHSMLMSNR